MQYIQRIGVSVLTSLPAILLIVASFSMIGCEQKEKVLDIETPGGEVEVERDKDGNVNVDVDTQ